MDAEMYRARMRAVSGDFCCDVANGVACVLPRFTIAAVAVGLCIPVYICVTLCPAPTSDDQTRKQIQEGLDACTEAAVEGIWPYETWTAERDRKRAEILEEWRRAQSPAAPPADQSISRDP